ncbi:hypothetical protein JW926_03040 [Candidatus Sumerlaeota bacterium]|nr:hypothetical protein [Candidatus Sumerlaeota bacterium]
MKNKSSQKKDVSVSESAPILRMDDVRDYYARMLISIISWIVERYHRDQDYGWINSKIDLLTGEDFDDGDLLRGKNTVYGWIQGRALEALALHAAWMKRIPKSGNPPHEMNEIIIRLYDKLQDARKQNRGHLYFMMDIDGKAFAPDQTGKERIFIKKEISTYNYSDLFAAKGMYAAANYLNDLDKINESRQYCLNVIDALWKRSFVSDQYSFRGAISGADDITFSLGPYMLCLGMITYMVSENEAFAKEGMKLLEYIMKRHINSPAKWDFGKEYDCIENVDHNDNPLVKDGRALSDPGHCLEFTGSALKFLHVLSQSPFGSKYKSRIADMQSLLIEILTHNFYNGFVSEPGGICKTLDLKTRKMMDSSMPWWSLPETMRAVCFAVKMAHNEEKENQLWKIFSKCHYSFSRNYVREDLRYMAIQTLGTDGKPARIIPATPDADPGYHTGVSMIDCLDICQTTLR